MQKVTRKVKVYGLDSTKDVRARLIEILQERAMYHKDKFIAPILWDEMRSMEVKKNGKVEHSDKTHDDNVFSYLMALYVWYDGKNLVENFGIRKNTLKTDNNEELEELDFEDAIEKKAKIDFRSSTFESNPEIATELEWIEHDKFVTSNDMKVNQYLDNIKKRDTLLSSNPEVAEAYILSQGGVNTISGHQPVNIGFVEIPDSLFTMDDNIDMATSISHNGTPLAGNLASFYDTL